jgi:hypothetical protein
MNCLDFFARKGSVHRYRSIALWIGSEQGLVHRIESLSAFALYVHSECGTHGRAAFAICANCGRASEVHDPALERVLRRFRVYARLARIEQTPVFRLRAIQSARA